jgi:2,4-didehydro-3-deoxy-L-rhamnonate hydrolase
MRLIRWGARGAECPVQLQHWLRIQREFIAGFVLHNDYSERGFQLERGGQWVKGKSADNFAPLGPFLATKDAIADVSNLHMWLKVNGTFRPGSDWE